MGLLRILREVRGTVVAVLSLSRLSGESLRLRLEEPGPDRLGPSGTGGGG